MSLCLATLQADPTAEIKCKRLSSAMQITRRYNNQPV